MYVHVEDDICTQSVTAVLFVMAKTGNSPIVVHFRTSTSWNVIQLLKGSLCIGIGRSLGYINMLEEKKEGYKQRVNIGIYIHISSKKIK